MRRRASHPYQLPEAQDDGKGQRREAHAIAVERTEQHGPQHGAKEGDRK
jgi:hypothetical protein